MQREHQILLGVGKRCISSLAGDFDGHSYRRRDFLISSEEQSGRNPIGAGYFMVRQQTLLVTRIDSLSEAHHVPRLGRGRIDS